MAGKKSAARKVDIELVGAREVRMTRVIAAPQQMVFDAWTRPDDIKRYFGERWTLPVCEVDLRVGGAWRYVLRTGGGMTIGMRGVFREIEAPTRLVTTEAWDDGAGGPLTGRFEMFPGESLNTSTVTTRDDGLCLVTLHVLYPTGEARDRVASAGLEHGVNDAFDRLEQRAASDKP